MGDTWFYKWINAAWTTRQYLLMGYYFQHLKVSLMLYFPQRSLGRIRSVLLVLHHFVSPGQGSFVVSKQTQQSTQLNDSRVRIKRCRLLRALIHSTIISDRWVNELDSVPVCLERKLHVYERGYPSPILHVKAFWWMTVIVNVFSL